MESKQTPIHLPFHNYAGPGTRVVTNIISNVYPINTTFDKASLIHDIEYLHPNGQFAADNNMWKNLITRPYLIPFANITRLLFLIKDVLGFKKNDYTNIKLYNKLKALAIEKGMVDEHMSFYKAPAL